MTTYAIQHTQKGDYIIRNQADRQLARFATEPEAAQWITEQQAKDAAESQERQEADARSDAFDATIPDLNQLQLTWQRWRNWFYATMMWSLKDAAAHQRAMDRTSYINSPSQRKQEEYAAQADEEDAAAGKLYEQAVALDSRIKAARREQDTDTLAVALGETEAMITRMNGFYLHAARPEQWGGARSGAGRPSLAAANAASARAADRTVRKTVTLPASVAAELEQLGDGNLSAGVRKAAERARRN